MDNCPSCESTDTRTLNCKAGELKVCRACGKSWNYNPDFRATPYKPKTKDNIIL